MDTSLCKNVGSIYYNPLHILPAAAPGCGPGLVESVVLVLKDGQWGTGVLLTQDTVLTCSHVIGDGEGTSHVYHWKPSINCSVIDLGSSVMCKFFSTSVFVGLQRCMICM